jgi:hypothetical protein
VARGTKVVTDVVPALPPAREKVVVVVAPGSREEMLRV